MEGLVFERDTPHQHIFPCLTCAQPLYTRTILATADKPSSTQHKLYWWLMRLTRFWKHSAVLSDLFLYSFVFFGAITLTLMFFAAARPFVGIFFGLTVLVYALSNYVPLSNMPLGCQNAITNNRTKYQGAFGALMRSALIIVVFALLIELIYNTLAPEDPEQTGIKTTTERTLIRVFSALLLVLPLVAVAYLLVHQLFVERPSHLPINPLFIDSSGQSNIAKVRRFISQLPSANSAKEKGESAHYIYTIERMRKLWEARGGIYTLQGPEEMDFDGLLQDCLATQASPLTYQ